MKTIRKAFTIYLLVLSVIGLFIIWGLMLVDKASADAPILHCQEGFTWFQTEWGEVCIENTPGPTLEMYPGVNTEASPYPTLRPYPEIDDAIMAQETYNPDPTATATRMAIVTRHGRGRP